MAELPSGTVTFLLTDVEGSTALWEAAPEAMRAALARHDALFDTAVTDHGGVRIRPRGEGDSRFAVFASAPDAVAAALAIQRAFAAEDWPTPRPIRVRIGVHTGEAELRDGDYYGSAVNRCARLRGIGHGGQVLLSEVTSALVRDGMPSDLGLLDLGRHRLKDLTEPERVSQVIAPDLPLDFAPLTSLDARPNNLPTHPTALLGRERELAEVRGLFSDGARLVTLTGPGGTGKTRLGLQVAADLLDAFEQGAFLVELAPISDPELVPSAIAQAIGVRDFGNRPIVDAVKEHLRSRSFLLLLDNFEQVLPAASGVADLLAACPNLAVLATSREPLRLRGEQEYAVPPLVLPDARQGMTAEIVSESPAVALFVHRARAVRADFALSDENAAAVAEVCARLDGLPLAIELAAARIKLLSPEAMLARLERRLPLLVGGARDLPERQRTLRDAVAWSYDLLDEPERRLFRRLAVFVGGCTIEAAETACDRDGDLGIDVLEGIGSLVDKNLLRREGGPDGEVRFGMLETIREYALERLDASGEAAEARRRHAEYYLGLAESGAPDGLTMWSGQGNRALRVATLRPERDNLRTALDWLPDQDVEAGIRLAGALWQFWHRNGLATEGRRRLDDLLDRSGPTTGDAAPTPARQRALFGSGMLALFQGDFDAARSLWERTLAQGRQLGDQSGIAGALHGLGMVAQYRDDDVGALAFLDEGVALARTLGDDRMLADALMYRGLASHRRGDYASARSLLDEGLAARRRAGSDTGLGPSLSALGFLALDQGDLATARARFEERLAFWQALGDVASIAVSIASLGLLALAEVDPAGARRLFAEGLTMKINAVERNGLSWYLACFAALALDLGETERAACLAGAASALRLTYGTATAPSLHLKQEHMLRRVQRAAAGTDGARAWADGEAMTLEQAVAYALDEQPPA